ncbi:YbaK/EbsC family protein, partial [Escherichia coli]|nr:YbaK/EbsC family protein [Escherichia coli]
GIPFEITGNVVVVHTHKNRKAPPDFAAAFVTADTLADLNGVVKHTLEVSKVSFAPIDAAVEATGMESGGMSPIGLPSDWPLLVDQHILSIPK